VVGCLLEFAADGAPIMTFGLRSLRAEITGRDLDLRAASAPGLKVCRRAPIARMNGQPRTGFSDKGNPRRGGGRKARGLTARWLGYRKDA
jgi:hypothetical protein